MSTIYKAAYEALKRDNSVVKDSADYCCLCFTEIAEESPILTDDEVILDNIDGSHSNLMAQIVETVFGMEFSDIMELGLNVICQACAKLTISSYKFIQQCKYNKEQFNTAVDNLTHCFENIAEDMTSINSMYVSINLGTGTIKQFYDNKKLEDKDLLLPRLHFLSGKQKYRVKRDSDRDKKKRTRDFSTIFIKTYELMADPDSKNYECKICHKVCATSNNLRSHFFSAHFKKDFQCAQCPKSFGTAGLLATHEKESHSTINCEQCGKLLLNRTSTIKRHELSHIAKLRKTCHRCGRSYKKTTDFKKHLEQETCEAPSRVAGDYVCNECGKHCHFKHQLTAHIKYEHSGAKGHVCEWCGRKCYNQSSLKVHILKHTREKNFSCDECGGKFVTRQSLMNHIRLHTGERPYQCDYCEQTFLSASRRKEHFERHHTDALFECDLCEAKYSAKRSLLQHKKRHLSAVSK